MTRRRKTISIIILAAIVAVAAGYGATVATSAYLDSQYESLHQGCSSSEVNHEIVIKDGVMTPNNTNAKACETLTIKNLDSKDRLIAFGVHDKHTAYDGVEERELRAGESFTVTLIQKGNFKVHDHMQDETASTFQVE